MSSDLHPYDGVDRRFRDDDPDAARRDRGRELAARLLGLDAPAAELRYDLNFYSGGIGVLDRLYVALPCSPAQADAIVARLGFVTPEAAVADARWREVFEWLIGGDNEEGLSLRALVTAFVAESRAEFQPAPDERARVWFAPDSGVNAWQLVYAQDGSLCLIAYDQG